MSSKFLHSGCAELLQVSLWFVEQREGSSKVQGEQIPLTFQPLFPSTETSWYLKLCPQLEDLAFNCDIMWHQPYEAEALRPLAAVALSSRFSLFFLHFSDIKLTIWLGKTHTFTGSIKTYNPLKVLRPRACFGCNGKKMQWNAAHKWYVSWFVLESRGSLEALKFTGTVTSVKSNTGAWIKIIGYKIQAAKQKCLICLWG